MIKYVLTVLALLIAPAADAQQHHHAGDGHATGEGAMAHGPTAAREPGQAAFAAIQEIVGILFADPHTDWSKVNIDGLRRHLVDMNNVTLSAKARAVPVENGMRFEVTGRGAVRASIRRMITAHAATMSGRGGWTYRAEQRPEGAALTVTVTNPADMAKLRGLGFFGVMAFGVHHQTHHLMIAKGMGPHR